MKQLLRYALVTTCISLSTLALVGQDVKNALSQESPGLRISIVCEDSLFLEYEPIYFRTFLVNNSDSTHVFDLRVLPSYKLITVDGNSLKRCPESEFLDRGINDYFADSRRAVAPGDTLWCRQLLVTYSFGSGPSWRPCLYLPAGTYTLHTTNLLSDTISFKVASPSSDVDSAALKLLIEALHAGGYESVKNGERFRYDVERYNDLMDSIISYYPSSVYVQVARDWRLFSSHQRDVSGREITELALQQMRLASPSLALRAATTIKPDLLTPQESVWVRTRLAELSAWLGPRNGYSVFISHYFDPLRQPAKAE